MVALNDIAEFSRQIVEEFHARRVILFGSHATGTAREDSDVDLLAAMEHQRSGRRTAARIIRRLEPRFGVDLLIRSEEEIQERIRQNDTFLAGILRTGRVLHESAD